MKYPWYYLVLSQYFYETNRTFINDKAYSFFLFNQHGSVGSNLVDDLPAPLIKKLFHFYSASERQIKLMEDENAGILVCIFQVHVKNVFVVVQQPHWHQFQFNKGNRAVRHASCRI
jgi:hypothetical protein